MSDIPYELVEMDPAKGKELTDRLTALLAEYDAEIGVKTEIHIWHRKPKGIVSPIQPGQENQDGNQTGTT